MGWSSPTYLCLPSAQASFLFTPKSPCNSTPLMSPLLRNANTRATSPPPPAARDTTPRREKRAGVLGFDSAEHRRVPRHTGWDRTDRLRCRDPHPSPRPMPMELALPEGPACCQAPHAKGRCLENSFLGAKETVLTDVLRRRGCG